MLRRTLLATLTLSCLVTLGGSALAQKKPGGGGGGGTPPPPDPAIVFVEKVVSKGKAYRNLRVINADGTNARTVVAGAFGDQIVSPCWSPDGLRIAFVASLGGAGGLWRVDTSGAGLVRLVAFPFVGWENADWSQGDTPGGGDRILFTTERTDEDNDLHVVNPDGSGLQYLGPVYEQTFSQIGWSQDGSKIALGGWIEEPMTGTVDLIHLGSNAPGSLFVAGTSRIELLEPYLLARTLRAANTADRFIFSDFNCVGLLDLGVSPAALSTMFTPGTHWVSFSPDDTRVVLQPGDGCIYTCAPDGTDLKLIYSGGWCTFAYWRRN